MKKSIILGGLVLFIPGINFAMEGKDELNKLADILNCRDAISDKIEKIRSYIKSLLLAAQLDPEKAEFYAKEIEKHQSALKDLYEDQTDLRAIVQTMKLDEQEIAPKPKQNIKEKIMDELLDTILTMHQLMVEIDPNNSEKYLEKWREAQATLYEFETLEEKKKKFKADIKSKKLAEAIEKKELNKETMTQFIRDLDTQNGALDVFKRMIQVYQYDIAQDIVDLNDDETKADQVKFLTNLLEKCGCKLTINSLRK